MKFRMEKTEELSSPRWSASFVQTTEDVASAVAAAAASADASHSLRPSVVYSLKDESGSPLQRLQHHVSRILKGLSSPPEVKSGPYNPEILTSQKRQWANFQLQSLDHRVWKEPSKLFESMVVVGLPPTSDIKALQNLYFARKVESSGRIRSALGSQYQSRVEPNLEPQVLFVYPPDKQLPLKYKDLLSFCFPAGIEVNAVERTPSMSELNEILLGQEHLKRSDPSFVFRLQVADDSTLYGCCVLVEEIIQNPSGLICMISDRQPCRLSLSRHILTTRRCYCILSRLPFFELHFSVLYSIFTEERLERLTKQIAYLDLETPVGYDVVETLEEKSGGILLGDGAVNVLKGTVEASQSNTNCSISGRVMDNMSQIEAVLDSKKELNATTVAVDPETEKLASRGELVVDTSVVDHFIENQSAEKRLPNAVLPLLQYQQCESYVSTSSFQGSPSEEIHFKIESDEAHMEETSFSGQDISIEHSDILEWAKANNHGSLQIICEYYELHCPARGSTVKFHPLDHLHPMEYHRPDETVLCIAGSTIDLRICNTSLELAECAHGGGGGSCFISMGYCMLMWFLATGASPASRHAYLRGHSCHQLLTLFAGALLEKQIAVVCSNLGILSASVLSIIPLIRPYQWQSLLMPVLPNDMLDFLDAPVPYIVGIKSKTAELQSKLTNVILVDLNKNQVKSPAIPQLPQHRELYSSLSPYHAKLVGESYLGKKRPLHECTDVQVEAAKSFLGVLRSYLDSVCSNLRSHTITNVQSNDDKVSLLLKESFIESFPSRDQPFMKLFSVHTDFVLSFFQKE
ncbi:uncharacterized protein LOC111403884 isoform X3 [Olea europaea var. sylvestris]|uniref:uncharacterized protein LOC111403884 isoform X3 n=1 Tax=Olea europaea var. sylvestris TaxID=158386 RepID=UPI000C1CF491|nr:uncharacterized protein LOC111403884 isoform X3 [Olea europaea var. sylvestris]